MTWRVGVSTGACIDRPILDVLQTLHDGGVTAVELGTPPRHFDLWKPDEVTEVAARLHTLSLAAVSIHAPFGRSLDLAHPDVRHREAGIEAILIAARTIKRLGGGIVVVHPSDLARHGAHVAARLDDAVSSLRVLAERCRDEDVQIALESPLPHLIGGASDEFAWLLSRLDDDVGVCLDTGHIALGHSWHRFVEVTRGRLLHVHASDNHGHYDDHLPPGEGVIDWTEIAGSLRAVGFAGWMILELRCPGDDGASYFRNAVARLREVAPAGPGK